METSGAELALAAIEEGMADMAPLDLQLLRVRLERLALKAARYAEAADRTGIEGARARALEASRGAERAGAELDRASARLFVPGGPWRP